MVYLQCPSAVIRARLRLESWSTTPPPDQAQWSGSEEVELELPSGVLEVHELTGGREGAVIVLPSPGRYRLRLHWALNPETGPFYSPFKDGPAVVETPSGHEQKLAAWTSSAWGSCGACPPRPVDHVCGRGPTEAGRPPQCHVLDHSGGSVTDADDEGVPVEDAVVLVPGVE
ncbi:hypothetical protein GCM10010381_27230 [Streptomyces xantholiticus]|nr:hypothetical protein GCM10010381_27230 [Streptomyces xantholiticus]